MEFGIGFIPRDFTEVVKQAKLAENVGFKYIWGWEEPASKNVFMLLTMIAMNTSKVKLGPGAIYPQTRNPAVIASSILTLNEISNGRALIGIGAGGSKAFLARIGISFEKPITLIRETIDVIRRFATGEKVDYNGEMIRINGLRFPWVTKHSIPIFVAGNGPKMLQLAGAVADGVLMAHMPAEYTPYAREKISEGAKKANRSLEEIEIGSQPSVCIIAEDYESAFRKAERYYYFAAAMALRFPFIMEKAGFSKDEISLLKNPQGRVVPDELKRKSLSKFAIVGTVEDCIRRLKEYEKAGVQHMALLVPQEAQPIQTIKLLADNVFPEFQVK
jgi:5,10-methylenetetrahydromethanopterin reductase